MSSKKPTKRQLHDWINITNSVHDLICDCNEGNKHFLKEITSRKEEIFLTKQEKEEIIKCLSTTEDHTTITGEDGIDAGDLEALFAEDVTEPGEDEDG